MRKIIILLSVFTISHLAFCAYAFRGYEVKRMRVTAYCKESCCCQGSADGITASGLKLKGGEKLVAAPKEYPMGTLMTIPGYGRVKVLDRGGAIKGNRLDVYFDSHKEALEWGVQYLNVRIER